MKIGERRCVIEPCGFGHEAFDKLQHAVGAVDKATQQLVGIDARLRAALIQPGLGTRGASRGGDKALVGNSAYRRYLKTPEFGQL